jgi:hypothetical protein
VFVMWDLRSAVAPPISAWKPVLSVGARLAASHFSFFAWNPLRGKQIKMSRASHGLAQRKDNQLRFPKARLRAIKVPGLMTSRP